MMKPVNVRLKAYYRTTNKVEKNLIEYILKHSEQVVKMSIHDLAKESFTSAATIIRFCKKLNFEGFKDFKNSLMMELTVKDKVNTPQEEITSEDGIEALIDKVIYKHMMSIEETKTLIEPMVFDQCISMMEKAQSIYLFGIGSSFLVAKDLQQKLMRINKPCICFEDLHMQFLQARNISPKDLAIFISYSGETKEIIECAKLLQESGASTVSITRFGGVRLEEMCDYNLYVTANEPLRRSGAMTSRIAQLCVIDMLYIAYVHRYAERSFKQISRTQLAKLEEHEEI
ncbi:MAG: MurR/RpiR family transcriptional regulator [Cellulosilyticaceae bacterium]